MWTRLVRFLEMIRFSHTIFALPFALLAAMMAWRLPIDATGDRIPFRWWHLAGIVICMVGARSAAMAFNRLADRRIDAENPRTRARHLPSGKLSVPAVGAFTVVASLVFIAGTLLFLPNSLPLIASPFMLAILLAYSYTKRFTSLAHFWLGLSLMLAPLAAWIALRGDVVLANPWDLFPVTIVGLIVMFWVAGFDIIYACQDYDFDVGSRLKSVPARLGVRGALRIALACHLVMIGLLAALPYSGRVSGVPLQLGWVYWVGVIGIGGLLGYEHWLVKPNDLGRVNVAFFHINAVVSIGLFAIVSLDLLLG